MSEVTVSKSKLSSALAACQRVTPNRTPKEILKLCRLEYDGCKLSISATDCEIAISIDVECDGDGISFLTLVDPAILRGLVTGSSDEAVLRMDGTTLVVECGGTGRIETSDAADFPPMPEFPDEVTFSVDGDILRAAIDRTCVACDQESQRAALGGVLFDCSDTRQSITLVATDSAVMIACDVAVSGKIDKAASGIVPLKGCKAISAAANGSVSVSITANAVFLTGDGVRMSAKLIEGRFPAWRKVVPAKHAFSVNVLAGAVRDACAKARLFATEESYGLDIEFRPGEMVISRKIDKGSFRHVIPHDNQDCELSAYLCHQRLSKAISASDASVEIRVIDDVSAFVIVDGDCTSVLMPLAREK